jgi:hypothetical protein
MYLILTLLRSLKSIACNLVLSDRVLTTIEQIVATSQIRKL